MQPGNKPKRTVSRAKTAKSLMRSAIMRKQLVLHKHEHPIPGRYASFYKPGKVPECFKSLNGEAAGGSTPGGFLSDWTARNKIDEAKLDRNIPQIKLIPKEHIGEYLRLRFEKSVATPEERRVVDQMGEKMPHMKEVVFDMIRNNLIAIDWAEHTYGIKIEVNQDVLRWIGKI